MTRQSSLRLVRRGTLLVAAAALAAATSCSSSDSDPFPSYQIRSAPFNAIASAPVVVAGRHAVYFASEQESGVAGTDLNGDGDINDSVAIYVDLQLGKNQNIGVAVRSTAIVQNRIFLVVEESDGNVDFDGGGLTSRVLLVWTPGPGATAQLVDTLPGAVQPDVVSAGNRLWYRGSDSVAAGETTLRFVTADAPTTPQIVLAADAETHVNVRPIRAEANILFCFIDEAADGIDHNGSGAANQTTVVALVDAAAASPRVRNTGLAVANAATPMVARTVPGGDRVVAFLVSETAQADNLNAPADFSPGWLPAQCSAITAADTDTTDDVLHWLRFAEWNANPVTSAPVNTGLAGTSRVVLLDTHVATLVPETAQGGGCDFNVSGATTDTVVRWVALQSNAIPVQGPAQNLAVATGTLGGASGLASLSNRFVAAVEVVPNASHLPASVNPPLAGKKLLVWATPTSTGWNPAIRTATSTGFASVPVAVTWMAAESQAGRLAIGFDESVGLTPTPPFTPVSLNSECGPVSEAKDNDTTDTIAAWLRFTGPATLQVFGVGYALLPAAPGIVLAGNHAFFRVSELHHNVAYSLDGDLQDSVLVRRPLTSCTPTVMTFLNGLVQPAILTDGGIGALVLVDEDQTKGPNNATGVDQNGDGKVGGFAIRFFRF